MNQLYLKTKPTFFRKSVYISEALLRELRRTASVSIKKIKNISKVNNFFSTNVFNGFQPLFVFTKVKKCVFYKTNVHK